MANSKISALTSATTVAGTEVLPIVQSSATVKVSVANLTPGLDTITAVKGGTGQTSYAVGDLLYANTTTTLAKLADVATGNALISGGVGVAPSWGKIGLTTHVSGTLPTANGGTNLTSFTANGVVYASSSSALATGSSLVFDGTNLGVGVTPSAWSTLTPAVQIGTGGTFLAAIPGAPYLALGTNIYYNGANWIYSTTNDASYYDQASGLHRWYTAPSGTAGNTATLTQVMSINAAGIVTMPAYGAGAATFSAAGVISSVSDETWKIKDGVPVDTDLMLNKLEPGYWYYNDEKKEIFGADRQLGFYAQNVHAAIGPEAAPTPEEGKPWGYYDRSVLAVTVMSLQKALAAIESLTARITALEKA